MHIRFMARFTLTILVVFCNPNITYADDVSTNGGCSPVFSQSEVSGNVTIVCSFDQNPRPSFFASFAKVQRDSRILPGSDVSIDLLDEDAEIIAPYQSSGAVPCQVQLTHRHNSNGAEWIDTTKIDLRFLSDENIAIDFNEEAKRYVLRINSQTGFKILNFKRVEWHMKPDGFWSDLSDLLGETYVSEIEMSWEVTAAPPFDHKQKEWVENFGSDLANLFEACE